MSTLLDLSRTLALIKPHAVRHRSAILRRVQMSGFRVLQERCVKLTIDQAMAFQRCVLSACETKPDVEVLSAGPMIALCLGRVEAVEKWKELMGPENCSIARQSAPTSLRALYGDLNDDTRNAVYGCMSDSDVEHELQFFFPNLIHEPIYGYDKVNEYLCSVIYQPLSEAVYEMTKVKPDDPLEWLASFMLKHNRIKPVVNESDPDTLRRLIEVKGLDQKDDSFDEKGSQPCGCRSVATTTSDTAFGSTIDCKTFPKLKICQNQ